MKPVEQSVVEYLKERKLKLTTVESCTGGLIAATIVNVSGASEVFEQGYVTYSEAAKCSMVGVDMNVIEKYGVVSAEVADAMAIGGARTSGADCVLSVTGVAGPLGGTKEIPVGTVYISCYYDGNAKAECFHFEGDRLTVRQQAVNAALNILKDRFESERTKY